MFFCRWGLLAVILTLLLVGCAGAPSSSAEPVPGWQPSHIEREINDGSRAWDSTDWQMWMNRMGGGR